MADNEISASVEIGLGGISPLQAKISGGFARRWSARGGEVVDQVTREVGSAEALQGLLDASDELDALLTRAALAGAETAFVDKRRLLGRAVSQAALDDAKLDESVLLVDIISQLEAVHVKSLELVARAESDAQAAGDMGSVAFGAEKPLTQQVSRAIDDIPVPVLRKLVAMGLLEAAINWDGRTHASGITSTGSDLLADLHAAAQIDTDFVPRSPSGE